MPIPDEVKIARREYNRECDEAWADFDAEGNEAKRIVRIRAARVKLEGVLDAWIGRPEEGLR